jgi:hypothetical protein
MEKLDLDALRIVEFIELGFDIKAALGPYDKNALGLESVSNNLSAAFGNLSDAYSREKGSALSKDIELADARRDQCIIGIKGVSEGYERHFDPAFASAASHLLQTIHKYGKSIATQNFVAESEILKQLCNELESSGPAKEASAKLGLSAWVAEMREANEAFIQLFQKKNSESNQAPVGNVKELRAEAKKQLQAFMAMLSALTLVSPVAELNDLLEKLNSISEKYEKILASRRLIFFEGIAVSAGV